MRPKYSFNFYSTQYQCKFEDHLSRFTSLRSEMSDTDILAYGRLIQTVPRYLRFGKKLKAKHQIQYIRCTDC